MATISNTIRKGNTSILNDNDIFVVKLYDTHIFTLVKKDNTVSLCTGGYSTNTTKNRMNETFRELNINANVYAKNKIWHVDYNSNTYTFINGICTFEL